jgi:PhzF family phenazine biosynthesis protein
MTEPQLHHLAAFSAGDLGGNPAGVWIGDHLPSAPQMQRIATDVGASETAFVAPARGPRRTIRYFSPETEVTFCGHATIATGIVLGESDGAGTFTLETPVGDVPVTVAMRDGRMHAALRSVATRQAPIAAADLDAALACLGWTRGDLDITLPPVRAWAGAWHYVIAVTRRETLEALDYDFAALKALMQREALTTLQLVWRERDDRFHSRNPFPIGGVVEDPATGAAAAALGGYLRDAGHLAAPFEFEVLQGARIGMPGRIHVSVPPEGGIIVGGTVRTL